MSLIKNKKWLQVGAAAVLSVGLLGACADHDNPDDVDVIDPSDDVDVNKDVDVDLDEDTDNNDLNDDMDNNEPELDTNIDDKDTK